MWNRLKKTTAIRHWQDLGSCYKIFYLQSQRQSWIYRFVSLTSVAPHLVSYCDRLSLQGGPKKLTPFVLYGFFYALISSNIDWFSNLFHYMNQENICNNTVAKDPTTPQVCRYTTLWNISVLKAKTENKSSVTTHFLRNWLIDWLGFNGTFSTVRLYRAFRSYSLRFGETPWESCTSPIQ